MFEEQLTTIRSQTKEYLELRGEHARLVAIEVASKYLSSTISFAVFTVVSLLLLLFASVAGGFYLNDLLESRYAGFLILSGFYALIIILLAVFRKKIFGGAVRNKLIREMLAGWKMNETS
ncbi:MAG: hypothetical protein HKN32_08355 [Flavobacteriales bacterium]|nr:hypothetical protein [Flavobacteriales bacterium]